MVKKIKWVGTLSTTERNNIGLIQVRQNNVNSEVLGFNIVDGNGEPYDLKNRKVLFCTYFDKFSPVEQYAEVIENGKIIYTMNEHDMQKPVRINFAYFKIMDEKNNLVDTTQNFSYDIMPSIESKCGDFGPYIIRLEEVLDAFLQINTDAKKELEQIIVDFNEQVIKQQQDFEFWFESIRDILESIDPGGILLSEIVGFRYSELLDKHFNRIKDRGDFWDESLSDISVNLKWFGAVGDNKTINDDAFYRAIAFLENFGGGTLYIPRGIYLINFVIKFKDLDITIIGEGDLNSVVKVKDQADLLHAERDYTSNQNTNLDNLFRDYHSVFFFENCDITCINFVLFGNAENNYMMINDKKFNYYAETIHSHLGVSGYRYYHGIDILWTDGKKHRFNMKYCNVTQFPWNNVCINNQGIKTEVDIDMDNNYIESSAQDGVSVHKVYGNIRLNNKIKNPNSHGTHIYHTVEDAVIEDEEYIFTEDDYFNFEPNVKSELRKHGLQIGHGSYVDNLLKNITVKRCKTTLADNLTYRVTGLFVGKTIENLYLYENDFSGCDYPMMIHPFVFGDFIIDNCDFNNYGTAGILFNIEGLADYPMHPNYPKPYSASVDIRNSSIVSKKADKNAIRFVLPGTVADEMIDKIKINLLENNMSASTVSQSKKISIDDNNSVSPNLINMSYEVVDGVAQGWRGRNSTNQYTIYTKQSGLFSDVSGQRIPLDFLLINTTGNPDVTFDNVTYIEKSRLSKGSHVFRFTGKVDNNITIRCELRNSLGELLATLIPETKINASSSFNTSVFYIDVLDDINTTNQYFYFVIGADNNSKKITNMMLAGVKLEKTDSKLPKMTPIQLQDYNMLFYSTNTVPIRAGLITIGGGEAYISVGNTKVSDWKKIT